MAAHQAGRLAEAEGLYRRILDADKKQVAAWVMLGVLKGQAGDVAEAERLLRRAVQLAPDDPRCLFNHANALAALGRLDAALAALEAALARDPGNAAAHLNRGGILMTRKQPAAALTAFDAALRLDPGFAAAHCNRGQALEQLGRDDEALASFERALALRPGTAEFLAARANVLHRLRRDQAALADLAAAIAAAPDKADFHYNRANILAALARWDEAGAAYDAALRLDPALAFAAGDRFFARAMLCDWQVRAEEAAQLVAGVRAGRAVARPFVFLAAGGTQADETRCANIFADAEFPPAAPLHPRPRALGAPIRIAYLSADFRDHPVARLIAGLIEQHDRARFEPIGLSLGGGEEGALRRRLAGAFARFVDMRGDSDAAIAEWMCAEGIDIAVDLMGPTRHARPGILAHRPAPVQVMYLGYAGSSGAHYVDYLLADRVVVPEPERDLYREKIVYLPDTFMVTDDRRAIAARQPDRAAEGLPPQGVVFCAFNASYKLTPPVFDVWMRLLRATDGSVLWLSPMHEAAAANLRREGQARGVEVGRLVFARRLPEDADHLARLRLADLYLDTLPIGAHSTAVDALWAGVPVVTCRGATFAGRVSASLAGALGVPDLVSEDLGAYEASALALARDPAARADLRARLARQRDAGALFDTARFTRAIEAAFTEMHRRRQAGEAPAHFAVTPPER